MLTDSLSHSAIGDKRVIVKVDPSPKFDSQLIEPFIHCKISLQILKPRPCPLFADYFIPYSTFALK